MASPNIRILAMYLIVLLYLVSVTSAELMDKNVASDKKTKYTLYTKKGDENHNTEMTFDTQDVLKLGLNPNNPTRIIIHDWDENETSSRYDKLRNYYNSLGDYNILFVNWSRAEVTNEDQPLSKHIERIGTDIATMVANMNKTQNVLTDDVVLIGVGMGAHIAGQTGKSLYNQHVPKVHEIIALDPSREFEVLNTTEYNLNKMDARGVIVYHTNVNVTGLYPQIGTVDIYVNDQKEQPGCEKNDKCSHEIALDYFLDASRHRFQKCRAIPGSLDINCHKSTIYVNVRNDTDYNIRMRGAYYLNTTQ